jgi:hypothetical protein
MISDPHDPVVIATRAVDAAQRDYDAALTSGRPLDLDACDRLAVRLAEARRSLRAAIFDGPPDSVNEAPALTRLLLDRPIAADEE